MDVSISANAQDLFAALQDLDRRCRENAAGLPRPEAVPAVWSGVVFRIGDYTLIAPLEEIREVQDVPQDIAPVPATKPWVRGIAGSRGTLLTLFDVRAFVFGVPTARHPKNRILVTRQDDLPCGLLVGSVVGMRHFKLAERDSAIPPVADALGPMVVGSFSAGRERYPIFSLSRLMQDARFNQATV